MSDIQAVVLDLDGALLGSDKSISPRNYEAVKRCYDSGIHIIVATARPPRAANQLEISHQINHFIKLHAAQSIINYEVNDSCYTCTPISDSELRHFGIRSSDPKPLVVDKDFLSSLSPTKILVHGYSAWIDIIEQFGDHVNVIATDGGVLVQIMHKSASKEDAVQWVLNEIGVRAENIMVFGDDFNDLGLFHNCGFPIAMENAIMELKNCAKHITESNDNDGVAVALEKLVL